MKKNMGVADRVIRVVLAIVLFDIFFQKTVTGYAGIIALTVACVFLLTSVVSSCPLYSLFGFNTCGHKKTM
jgi:hypothetical protein